MVVMGTGRVILSRNHPGQNVQNVLIRYGAESCWLTGENGGGSHRDSQEGGLWGVGRWKGERVSGSPRRRYPIDREKCRRGPGEHDAGL